MSEPPLNVLVEDLFRRESVRLAAMLARRFGAARLQLAEDLTQEALVRALRTWPWSGVPDDPAGWLHVVARRLAIDALRREGSRAQALELLVAAPSPEATAAPEELDPLLADDELRLLFLCAHPLLSPDMRIALTLKVACGFSVREIARGLLREEAALAQTLVRAKRRLREAPPALELPPPEALPQRLGSVIDALHLMFSEGYEASVGDDLVRAGICREALRLAEMLAAHAMATPQAHALAALFSFQAARLRSRVDGRGDLVPLAQQDRSLWDAALIARGWHHLAAAARGETLTEHHLLAAIAGEHVRAADFAATDWAGLLDYYDLLVGIAPSPVHRLNRAVTLAELHGPALALAELDALARDGALAGYHLFHATRAELLRRVGDVPAAAVCLAEALRLAPTPPIARLLQRRMAELTGGEIGRQSPAAC